MRDGAGDQGNDAASHQIRRASHLRRVANHSADVHCGAGKSERSLGVKNKTSGFQVSGAGGSRDAPQALGRRTPLCRERAHWGDRVALVQDHSARSCLQSRESLLAQRCT